MEKQGAGNFDVIYRNFRCLHRNFRWAGYLRGESPPKTCGTPPERKLQKDLAKIPPENFHGRKFRPGGRNFRATENFRGELPGRSSGTPPERDPKNDLAVFSLGRKKQGKIGPELPVQRTELPRAGISGLRSGTSTPTKNYRKCKMKAGISFASGLHFR